MSRNTVSVNLSDSYALLLNESLKENQALRQQLKERDEESDSKLRDFSNKVDSLCQLLAEKNSGINEEKAKNCKVHVPTRCRVRSLLRTFISDAYVCSVAHLCLPCLLEDREFTLVFEGQCLLLLMDLNDVRTIRLRS